MARFALSRGALLSMVLLAACQGAESTAPAVPGATPSHLVLVEGGAQQALAGVEIPLPVRVRVTDQHGTPMPGQSVTFGVNAGGGLLAASGTNASSVSTGPDGVAAAPLWTLGLWNTPQVLTATLGALSLDITATIATQTVIDVRYVGLTDPAVQTAMSVAVARVTAMLTEGLPPIAVTNFDVAAGCGLSGAAALTETIRGVVVYVNTRPMDGPYYVVGQTTQCLTRPGGMLPAVAMIEIDVADVTYMNTSGFLQDFILHELLHAMGFGGLWWVPQRSVPLTGLNSVWFSVFTGTRAHQACTQIPGVAPWACDGGVLLATAAGATAASAGTHWNEDAFQNELMTPSFKGRGNPLSAMTIASMGDLGYTVNLRIADAFQLPSAALAGLRASQEPASQTPLLTETVHRPRFTLTSTGTIVPVPQ